MTIKKCLRVVIAICIFCGPSIAKATSGGIFRQWGQESLTELKTDYRLSSNLFAKTITDRNPAYAWGHGVMLSALTAACKLNSSYLAETKSFADALQTRYWCTLNGTSGYNASYGGCGDRYYDDNAWIALGLIELYMICGETKYLDRAKATVVFCMSGENGPENDPPGGIRWHESNTGGSSVCAGAPTSLANLMLYQITGIESYKTDGQRIYDWLRTCGLHQYASGIYHEVNQGPLGYQTAVVLQTAVRLYQVTGDTTYLTEAQRLAAAMEHQFINKDTHVLNQTGKWGGHDMTNAYVDLYEADHNRHWLDIAAGYIRYLHDNGKDTVTGRYPTSWNDTTRVPSADLLDNASVARAYWKMASAVGGAAPVYTQIKNRSSGQCLRLYNSGTADNTGMVLYDEQPTYTSEMLTLVDLGNGYYNIRSWSSDKALQPYNSQTANNTSVVIFTANAGLHAQQWALIDVGNGYFNIQNRLSGKSLQPYNSNTANNTTIITYTTNLSQSSQQWQFVGFTPPSSITPYVSADGQPWVQTDRAVGGYGETILLKGQASGTGTYSWTGPNGFTASGSEVAIDIESPRQSGLYILTFVNAAGVESHTSFNISVSAAVTLYQNCDYTGWQAKLGIGAYTAADLVALGGVNNDASSLKILPGYTVTFYDYDNFQGSTLVKTADDACFVDDGWNDRVTSLIIEGELSPQAHWMFNEKIGLTVSDASGNNRSGQMTNMDQTAWTVGKQCGGLLFDGVDDYVEVPGYKGIRGPAGRTCCAWIKTTTANTELLSWGSAQNAGKWLLLLDAGGRLRVAVNGGNIVGTTVLNDNRWHHIAVVLDNDGTADISESAFYVDGILENISSSTGFPVNSGIDQNVQVGFSLVQGAYRYYTGQMDEVLIYNKALSAGHIRRLYLADALTSDVESDGQVDLADLSVLTDDWLGSGTGLADLTCDGIVNSDDFMVLAEEWLRSI